LIIKQTIKHQMHTC